MDKKTQRTKMLKARTAIVPTKHKAASASVTQSFFATSKFTHNKIIAAYLPIRGELDLTPLIEACHQTNRQIALPRVENNQISFLSFSPQTQLVKNSYGILEPPTNAAKLTPDLILIPCLAFDKSGNRLGYGAGHYDRTLPNHSAIKVGVAFAAQMVEQVSSEPHDVKLDAVLTETGVVFI